MFILNLILFFIVILNLILILVLILVLILILMLILSLPTLLSKTIIIMRGTNSCLFVQRTSMEK